MAPYIASQYSSGDPVCLRVSDPVCFVCGPCSVTVPEKLAAVGRSLLLTEMLRTTPHDEDTPTSLRMEDVQAWLACAGMEDHPMSAMDDSTAVNGLKVHPVSKLLGIKSARSMCSVARNDRLSIFSDQT